MSKNKVYWKENKVISVRLKEDIFVLAQMLKSPYLVFFNLFSNDDKWDKVALSKDNVLFCHAVTNQFLKSSKLREIEDICSIEDYGSFQLWIVSGEFEKVTVWKGTIDEKSFISVGTQNCFLVEKDIQNHQNNTHHSGIYKQEIRKLTDNDYDSIKNYELTTIEIYPNLNERLFLCYKLKKNVDPSKEIMFKQQIPLEYKTYVNIISGTISLTDLGY